MGKLVFTSLILFTFFSLLQSGALFAWDNVVTHKGLSEYAAETSILSANNGDYLKNLGFNLGLEEVFTWGVNKQTVTKWIREGADLEDNGSRPFNHFHNPLQPWLNAGLWGSNQSALLWSQSYNESQQPMADDWSWQRTRKLYHLALTSWNPVSRSMFFAETFRGVGQQMHLIQDMAVPTHVRNDAHPLDPFIGTNGHGHYFETWTKNNITNLGQLKAFAPTPVIPQLVFSAPTDTSVNVAALAPITNFYDTNQYVGTNPSTNNNIGLAEYTNANYFSDDTISMPGIWTSSSHSFPYPNAGSTNLQDYINNNAIPSTVTAEDGVTDLGFWIQKTGSEPITHFVKPGYFTTPLYSTLGGGAVYERTFFLDDECHHDYAEKLLPRAVGYSAGILNYFFRGTLEISTPSAYVYSIIDGSAVPQQFAKIKAKVKNTTPNENVGTGSFQAVARYKVIPNYTPDLSNYPPDGSVMTNTPYLFSVSTATVISSLSSTTPEEFTFDFSNSPIPAGITDLTLQVAFKGTLGNEADNAVAVGMRDLMEPTHLALWNLTDMFSLDGHLYTAGTITNDPDLLARTNGVYFYPYSMHYEIGFRRATPPTDPIVTTASVDLPAGRYARLIVLADTAQPQYYLRLIETDTINASPGQFDIAMTEVINQADQNGQWQTPTPEDVFRHWLGPDGTTQNPFIQHYSVGVLRCTPVSVDPATGHRYCEYPEEEAIAAEKTSYPAMLSFP
jgi:hypothetical protein